MGVKYSITEYFGSNLAALLADKILEVDPSFDKENYMLSIDEQCEGLSYTQRVVLHARVLRQLLPLDFEVAIDILEQVLGPENPHETGMFKNFYWILPIGKFIELFGLGHFERSMKAIEEVTKRNTGEYAVRPFIRQQPEKALAWMEQWAKSDNFHLRRLASEGLRPKLPWAPKLDTFIEQPTPVFRLLDLLREDSVKFVQKSVANHLTDYLKVNPEPTELLLNQWLKSDNKHTRWIVKHATRKLAPELCALAMK